MLLAKDLVTVIAALVELGERRLDGLPAREVVAGILEHGSGLIQHHEDVERDRRGLRRGAGAAAPGPAMTRVRNIIGSLRGAMPASRRRG